MAFHLGIDTSNYTTSAAIYDSSTGTLIQKKSPLTVKSGDLGLRQSDAVFQHTINLPSVLEELFKASPKRPDFIAASDKPRAQEGSYMPCFSVGSGYARSLSAVFSRKCFFFSHQAGHIAAALYSSERIDLFSREFIAFHVSGGTSEAVMVSPHENEGFVCRILASSLDLKCGQLVDRVGVMLGLTFPAGPALEKLALQSEKAFKIKPSMRENNCSFSGVENRCRDMLNSGEKPSDIAFYCIDYISKALSEITGRLLNEFGEYPIVFAGGVMSNKIIQKEIKLKFDSFFASDALSSDNAGGIALLSAFNAGELKI